MEKLHHLSRSLHWFLDPDNPLVPWMLLIDLAVLLVHISIVYWVYRDALWRYNRGAPWALATALIPVGGWMFYLFYRNSNLVQYDREEAELFDDTEHVWTDFDQYKQDTSQSLFQELGSALKRPEGQGYSPWVRDSRERELGRKLTPEEKAEQKKKQAAVAAENRAKRQELALQRREQRKQKALESKERQTVTGAHGNSFKLSDRKQRAVRKQLALLETLKALPREDPVLEDLIYEMRYQEALDTAKANLALAAEMQDPQGQVTAEAYIERLGRLLNPEAENSPAATAAETEKGAPADAAKPKMNI